MRIRDTAPIRFNRTLAQWQWPDGHPMGYILPGGREVCGACASKMLPENDDLEGFAVLSLSFAFRCRACRETVFRRSDDFARFPLRGMRKLVSEDEKTVGIVFRDGRFLRDDDDGSQDEASMKALEFEWASWDQEMRTAFCRHRENLPITDEQRAFLREKGLLARGREGSAYSIDASDLAYEFFKSIPREGIDRAHPSYELVMDAVDLHEALGYECGFGRRLWEEKKPEEAVKYLRGVRNRHPRHLTAWALLALTLEKLGRDREARWEWDGLGDAFAEAGLPKAAENARKGSVDVGWGGWL